MGLYPDEPELDALHEQWSAAQARMIEAHNTEREAVDRVVATRSPGTAALTEPTSFEDLLVLDGLIQERREATDEWVRIDVEYTRARDHYLEQRRLRDS